MPTAHIARRLLQTTAGRLASALVLAIVPLLTLGLPNILSVSLANSRQGQTGLASGNNMVYFPLAQTQGTRGGEPTPTTPPVKTAGGLFLTRDIASSGADIDVDAAGGIHVTYAGYVGYLTQPSPVYYGYCAPGADCFKAGNWKILSFGSTKEDYFVKSEIELTAAGQPRLLMYNDYNGRMYSYAACDTNCGEPTNWKSTEVAKVQSNVDMDTFSYSYHTFELDPQGRPRFLYEDHQGSTHNGLYYVFCDADCTNGQNWYEMNISLGPDYDGDRVQTPDLKFTRQGQPRILTQLYTRDERYPQGLYYITCDQDCDDKANWQHTRLYDRGNGHASWTLALNANDQPRVAFYQGELENGAGNRLYYAWCNSDCADTTKWDRTPINIVEQNNGQSPSIALDSQGRPRIAIAIKEDQGIGYLWCDNQCEAAGAQWKARNAESLDDLNKDFPRPAPYGCDVATWLGARPQLALDAAGNPRIGYDGEYLIGNNFLCKTTIEYRSTRFTFFPHP